MLFGMKSSVLVVCLVFGGAASSIAQEACSKPIEGKSAATVASLRKQLRAITLNKDDVGTDVPELAQRLISQLKSALAQTAQAVVACHDGAADTKTVEREMATLLHANPPQPPPNATVYKGDPRYPEWLSDEYGSNLLVTVDQPRPQLLSLEFQFHIECGDDTVWMLFEQQGSHWRERLIWQAPPYKEISGAFGDFFVTAILPESSSDGWRVVAAHGRPWCTSRFSGFNIDVLAPTDDPEHPRVVWHTERDYSRGDYNTRLSSSGDTFELRLHDDEMHFDMDAFERLVVYRYRVSGDKVIRLEPIAANARGFVEEWLSMPWEEALAQSDTAQADKLRAVHKEYEISFKGTGEYTSWHSGPVQACTTHDHFQVTMTTERERIVPGKPGGESTPGSTYLFQLQQDNGYRLLKITTTPDPSCAGPDLMKKP
jgi:hypothetical protein